MNHARLAAFLFLKSYCTSATCKVNAFLIFSIIPAEELHLEKTDLAKFKNKMDSEY